MKISDYFEAWIRDAESRIALHERQPAPAHFWGIGQNPFKMAPYTLAALYKARDEYQPASDYPV